MNLKENQSKLLKTAFECQRFAYSLKQLEKELEETNIDSKSKALLRKSYKNLSKTSFTLLRLSLNQKTKKSNFVSRVLKFRTNQKLEFANQDDWNSNKIRLDDLLEYILQNEKIGPTSVELLLKESEELDSKSKESFLDTNWNLKNGVK